MRDRFGAEAVLVGFTTFTGTVTAATDWDAPAGRRHVRPALAAPRLERAIGVIHAPQTERRIHYFYARAVPASRLRGGRRGDVSGAG